jgi:hypothetical protein
MTDNHREEHGLTLRPFVATLFVLFMISGASQAVAAPLSTATAKQAAILSPLESWMQTWNMVTYVSLLQYAGYQVDVLQNDQVSISFLKTGLAKYDLIILRTDFFNDESLTYFCSGEPVTSNTAGTFASEISAKELRIGVCLGFSILFLRDNYQNGTLHGLVYALGGGTAELSGEFLRAGSSVFIGYDQAFSLQWGRMDAYSQQFLKYLVRGYSVEDAQVELRSYLITGHGVTADWPEFRWIGDGNYKI